MPKKTSLLINLMILTAVFLLLGSFYFQWSRSSPKAADDGEKKIIAAKHISELAGAVISFSNKHERFPATLDDLIPEYLNNIPLDPYGRSYQIINNGADKIFLYYFGKDGRSKGLAERDQDIAAVIINNKGKFQLLE